MTEPMRSDAERSHGVFTWLTSTRVLDALMRVIGVCLLATAVYCAYTHQWASLVMTAPVGLLLFTVNNMMNLAFRQGWHAATSVYDEIAGPELGRALRWKLYGLMRVPMTRRAYDERMEAMVRDLADLIDPTPEDVIAVYERHHPRI